MKHVDYNTLIKVCIVGDERAGKSALVFRYSDQKFLSTYIPTFGVEFAINEDNPQMQITFQLWDISGALRKVQQSAQLNSQIHDEGGYFLLRFKACDSLIANNREEAEANAAEHDMIYLETSSKEDEGVNELFDMVLREAISLRGLSFEEFNYVLK
ncbi:unnamed protein product [Sphagnum jensenii]|uniref:Uncharacterized protein n=1 Tax=Sphagnum jensenii TaxID=128206 RepID=A0ABP0VGR9_9BRYO